MRVEHQELRLQQCVAPLQRKRIEHVMLSGVQQGSWRQQRQVRDAHGALDRAEHDELGRLPVVHHLHHPGLEPAKTKLGLPASDLTRRRHAVGFQSDPISLADAHFPGTRSRRWVDEHEPGLRPAIR